LATGYGAGAAAGAGAGATGAAGVAVRAGAEAGGAGGMNSPPTRQAATKSFLVWPAALIATLFAAYSALHSLAVFPPAVAAGVGAGAVAAGPALVGTTSVPALQAAIESAFF
jgi:hypothetical protein